MATMYPAHSAHSAHSAYPAHSVHGDEREPSSFRTLGSDRPWRFSWGAVLAGATISLGMWMLLHVLGLGTGLTAIDPDDPNSLEAIGMGTGIWSLIVPLVALFLGGLATAKVAGPITRLGGAIHGAVLWALATLAATVAVVGLLSSVLGGTARLASGAVSSAGQVMGGVSAQAAQALSGSGIGTDDLLGPINERLQREGRLPISGGQLSQAALDALRTSMREGQLDRQAIASSLASNTGLSERDSQELATTLEQRFNQGISAIGQQFQQAGATALQAAETTGKGLLGLFFAMLLGLVAAVLGTIVGVTRAQRAVAEVASARVERLVGRHA